MAYQKFETQLAGKTLTIETGHIAEQANGAAIIRMGDTMLLVTAVASRQPREGIDFFPLTCDYEEKLYAAGRIPGSFPRREGRPSEAAILTSRMIDRPMRPLFPKDFRNDVQVVATVLSADQEQDPTTLAVTGASLALQISGIPHAGPVGCVRVGMLDGRLLVNPSLTQLAESELDLVVAGTQDAITMVEAGARQVAEATMLQALRLGHDEIRHLCEWQQEIRAAVGKPQMDYPSAVVSPEVASAVRDHVAERIGQAARNSDKGARDAALDNLKNETVGALEERFPEGRGEISKAFEAELKKAVRGAILYDGVRPDGRRTDEIRPIWSQVGVLPRTHGSALFTRGQTQALSIVTLGSGQDQQKLDGLGLEEFKRFMHHYNFPPFSVGEARPLRSPGRREIGHGALAERAVHNVMPDDEEFPYVVRIVSEILSSNGSTSMASVCGTTLALMDAGVPLRAPVAGIAMGLITDENAEHAAILSDIQGMEDALGDMDFKVAGSETGITALQMDIKIKGLRWDLLERALEQARQGRLHILGKMAETLPGPRAEMSQWAPRIDVIQINPDKIRDVIGPGGKTIRRIVDETGAQIDIEDDGRVFVASSNAMAREQALAMIRDLTDDIEVGRIYKGKVSRLMSFGAFVEIMPKKEGLVRIGHLAEHRVEKVEDVVNVGDEIWVKVIEIDDRGRVNLSRREAIRELAQNQTEAAGAGTASPA
ncbi:MAG: polyribonucleotide nucleotidyltransferase [Candidatus Dormibacteraeota bacterium]|nr:polyribonucleotide nucleotidyltransferase [Candidatus Dormibacteraeota bacterium]MBV9525508.1 polyribonucleotide nucleotidyltransferase [Candidatus Dormibacteraeota bacterium]